MNTVPASPSRWPHAIALWSLFWRMPVVAGFGTLALTADLGLSVVPPTVAVLLVVGGDPLGALGAALCIGLWLVWLRFGGAVRRFVFEGWEHSSL
jgi:hypothetical protein